MKRSIRIVLLIGAMIVSACATVPKTPLSPNDVPILKGQWEGARDMIWGKYRSYDYTVMEIYNDTIPLKGKVNIAFMEGSDPRVYTFENGIIDPEGNLSVQLQENIKFILSFYREEKKLKLDGYYHHRGNMGRLTLYKK